MKNTSALLAERLKRSRARLEQHSSHEFPQLTPCPQARFDPFPLTEMQRAYWLGRSAHVEGGNIGTHGYFEVENDSLEPERFITAWRKLLARHDMLRAVVTETGEQIVLEHCPEFNIPVLDLSCASEAEAEKKIAEIRAEMSHAVYDLVRWPWFDVRITLLPGGKKRIHLGMDGWCLDGWSHQIIFRDLAHFYAQGTALAEPSLLYRDYVLAAKNFEESPRYQNDLAYWKKRLETLPAPPLLLEKEVNWSAVPQFRRQSFRLGAEKWSSLKKLCREHDLTVSSCLLTAFGEILAAWAREPKFVINVPRFDRMDFHPGVHDIIGQFGSFTLFEMDCSAPATFAQRARAAQERMWEDLQHNTVSGVRILREAAKMAESSVTPQFPFVFTTAPERVVDGKKVTPGLSLSALGRPVFSLTQTPQVKLDCQYLEQDNDLVIFWDCIDSCFQAGMIDVMFKLFTESVSLLSSRQDAWERPNLFNLSAENKSRLAAAKLEDGLAYRTPGGQAGPFGGKSKNKGPEKAGAQAASPLLEELAALWAELTGMKISAQPESNFFALGGDSLQAIRLALTLRKRYRVKLAADAVFQFPTLASQVTALEQSAAENLAADSIPKAYNGGPVPMSQTQSRLWLLHRLNSGGNSYTLPFLVRINGQLDTAALESALELVFERHISLRSCFPPAQGDALPLLTPVSPWRLPLVKEDGGLENVGKIAREEADTVFNLSTGPLAKLRLVRHNAVCHTLFLTLHHIIFDGWSLGLFFSELSKTYASITKGGKVSAEPPKLGYADYTLWQQERTKLGTDQKGLGYWRKQLEGLEKISLPLDFPRPERMSSSGGLLKFHIPQQTAKKIDNLARECGATAQQILLAAFALTLGAVSGQHDISLGVPVAGRTSPDVEDIIGFFVNTLVIRVGLPEESDGWGLIAKVRDTMTEAQRWQDVSFADIVGAVAPERDLAHNPLYQVTFDVQTSPSSSLKLPGLQTEFLDPPILTTRTDLDAAIYREAAGYRGYLAYTTVLFKRDTAQSIVDRFLHTLQKLLAQPQEDLSAFMLPTPQDLHKMEALIGEEHPIILKTIVEFFEEKVAENPDAPAVFFGGEAWNRARLWKRSSEIAAFLIDKGVKPHSRVVLRMPRSADWLAALIGVHRAGAAVAAIDLSVPEQRKDFMIERVSPSFILTLESMPPQGSYADRPIKVRPDINADAFILFTSGSTGMPKAARLSQLGAANRLQWGTRIWPFKDGDHVCQKTLQAFGDYIMETCAPLIAGVPLTIVPDEDAFSPRALLATFSKSRATRVTIVPSVLSALLDEGLSAESTPDLRLILCSGEHLPAALIARVRKQLPGARIWNVYGSTEVTADVAAGDVTDFMTDPVPIGKASDNTTISIRDEKGRLLPFRAPGRIVVHGVMVSPGYIGKEQKGFNRSGPETLFDTGDLGRWTGDGLLQYLGRADRQIKIRGVRVEPAEIESVLNKLDCVKASAVTGIADSSGQTALCAIILTAVEDLTPGKLRDLLKPKLQEAFIPARWAIVDKMPYTGGGKVDWTTFNTLAAGSDSTIQTPPSGPVEERLAGIWKQFCDAPALYRDSNFFLSGGHSLSAARLSARIESEWGLGFSLADVFSHSTLREMAAELSRRLVLTPRENSNSTIEEGII